MNHVEIPAAPDQQALLKKLLLEKYEPVAVVGIGLRLPGSSADTADFLEFLRAGRDGIGDIPLDRWDNALLYSKSGGRGSIKTNSGGYLANIADFDAKFFNISPKEADYIDPQQRLVLEVSWEALEHAQIDPEKLRGSDGAVFVGVSSMDYSLEVTGDLAFEEYEGYVGTGTAHSAISGRVAYFLGWRGPAVTVDTACSSSLVAIHQAVTALRRRECNIALAGGVNLIHHPSNLVILSQASMLSPDGRCKTFDEAADGYGRSEGCAMIALKRISDALADGDSIIAIVRGSSVRQDGESGGLTVPNGTAQELVMRKAIESAALLPQDIGLVEAHGTGTSLGDPIEVAAINNLFSCSHSRERPITISSVKANIGHSEAAAGVIGVIKAALQIQHAQIFPQAHLRNLSQRIPWDRYVVDVPQQVRSWNATVRRCLVNSFGFSGTIASVVLEQAPQRHRPQSREPAAAVGPVFTLSAKSHRGLLGQIERFQRWLEDNPAVELEALSYASNCGRSHFPHRLATYLPGRAELREWLSSQLGRLEAADGAEHSAIEKVAFLFSGQGSQSIGMGDALYGASKPFRAVVDECDRLFAERLGCSIKQIMFGERSDAAVLLDHTLYTQAALFTLEYALAKYWIALGAMPSCLIGHSIGEIAAAAVAEVFSLGDAVRMVAARGTLMQSVNASGGMLAVRLDAESMRGYLAQQPSIGFAAINAPDQCVVSGASVALQSLAASLAAAGVDAQMLRVSHAFHSSLMSEVAPLFRQALDGIRFCEPRITLISNLTGEVARAAELMDPEYWVRHIEQPVLFARGMRSLAARGQHICIEVGPSAALCSLGRRCIGNEHAWVPSLRPQLEDTAAFAQAVALYYRSGGTVRWDVYHAGVRHPRVELPFYAFERRRHWLPAFKRHCLLSPPAAMVRSLLGEKVAGQSGRVEYCSQIKANSPAHLADHQVMGRVMFPGAGYVETLIELQTALHGESGTAIANIQILEPLYLGEAAVQYATVAELQADRGYAVRILSRTSGAHGTIERIHVTARLQPADDVRDIAFDLQQAGQAVAAPTAARITSDDLYAQFGAMGLAYGAAFQKVREVVHRQEVAVGTLDAGLQDGELRFDATVLDCAFQVIAALVPRTQAYLPVGFDAVSFFKQPRGRLVSIVKLQSVSASVVKADLLIMDGPRAVCCVRGFTLKAVESAAQQARCLFHRAYWRKRALMSTATATVEGVAVAVIGLCKQAAFERQMSLEGVELSFHDDWPTAQAALNVQPGVRHLVYAWTTAAQGEWQAHYRQLLQIVRCLDALQQDGRNIRLWLVTERAQLVVPGDAAACLAAQPEAASLWGFGATLLNEYPRLKATLVDLPDLEGSGGAWRALAKEILAAGAHLEYQIAFRDGQRHVKRLAPYQTSDAADQGNFELQIDGYGLFKNLRRVPIENAQPMDDQVCIEVAAAGLNFKDVLNALGLLKQHAQDNDLPYVALPLGFEAAGTVVAVGPRATHQVGDAVLLSHLGCFRKRLNVASSAAIPMPSVLDFAQAAAVPTAFITAYYSLHHLARIKRGDRVLIHAAAGGVGQAAIQLARLVGAEVYATASPHKWELLRAQGIEGVMNSRTLEFEQQLLALTGGEGVDIVLNSLNKDFIPAGLRCLRSGGHFVELGKIGAWDQSQVDALRRGVRYHNFDLGELPSAEIARLNSDILKTVTQLLQSGQLQPLPITCYTVDECEEAFSVLSRGANIGKLVITFTERVPAAPELTVDDRHRYVITGGFGALGQVLAGKLSAMGARHIALWGRKLPLPQHLDAWRKTLPDQVMLECLAIDISDGAAVERAIGECAQQIPLGAVFHLAGVLEDAPLRDQTMDSFQRVFAPKVQGANNILAALRTVAPLAGFIGFSSIAATLGPVSQGNYAAANAYLDHLLSCHRQSGRSMLSINWGPWAEVGMAAQLNATLIKGIEKQGVRFLKSADGLGALALLLKRLPAANTMVGEFDWNQYAAQLSQENPLVADLAQRTPVALFDLEAAQALPRGQRRAKLLHFVRQRIAAMLHFESAEEIEPYAKFIELGLDSLVAVEMKNSLEMALGIALPASLMFDYPSIPALVDHLLDRLWPLQQAVAGIEQRSVEAMSTIEVDHELEALRELG